MDNAAHIRKKLNNPKPTGSQFTDGRVDDANATYCWLPLMVNQRLVCAWIDSNEVGGFYA